jgi:hypothetical protein
MNDVIWLPAPNLNGYEISSDGRLRSLDRVIVTSVGRSQRCKGRVLKAAVSWYGYHILSVKVEGVSHNVSIHRLMCEAFHGTPEDGQVVRHLNGIRLDNRPENLTWGTPKENSADMLAHGNHLGANQTGCNKGHPFDEENTRIDVHGGRACRACDRIKQADRYRTKRRKRAAELRDELRRVIDVHADARGSGGSLCDCSHFRGEHDWTYEKLCEVADCECDGFAMERLVSRVCRGA